MGVTDMTMICVGIVAICFVYAVVWCSEENKNL
jgi:hypothetical protein